MKGKQDIPLDSVPAQQHMQQPDGQLDQELETQQKLALELLLLLDENAPKNAASSTEGEMGANAMNFDQVRNPFLQLQRFPLTQSGQVVPNHVETGLFQSAV